MGKRQVLSRTGLKTRPQRLLRKLLFNLRPGREKVRGTRYPFDYNTKASILKLLTPTSWIEKSASLSASLLP